MGATRRPPVRLRIVTSEEMVEHVTGVGEEVGGQCRLIFRKQCRNRLEGFEGFFPCGEPNVDLLFPVR